MITNYEKNYNIEKIKAFDKAMIKASKTNNDVFQFEGKQYIVCSYGECVQTLINDRILYRIFTEEHRNDISVGYKLLKYL
ncbi:hypothetical protein [Clostridium sp. DJ247]|uniref:hypothetical protein n=1 Tax=Clostridium sp. DJ247 TaxID=2726188 RepID=UPI001629B00E|nr:hypothetical protein [Clostridium sp. DJ247]MBC2582179.1 hypothetical protein [Clostridium sp. DJ247]